MVEEEAKGVSLEEFVVDAVEGEADIFITRLSISISQSRFLSVLVELASHLRWWSERKPLMLTVVKMGNPGLEGAMVTLEVEGLASIA